MQQCFPSEKLLWLCVNVLFNADIPGSCTEAGLVASTIISLAAAVMVCNPLLPCSACQGSWLVMGTAVKSEVVQVNQLNRIKKKKALLKADKTDDGEAINALREHKQISRMFHQAATQIHLSLSPSQVFTQRSFVNFYETSLMPFGHHPWTLLLTAKRTNFTKKGNLNTLYCATHDFSRTFWQSDLCNEPPLKNICILLCPCNSRTTCIQAGGDVDLLIILVST